MAKKKLPKSLRKYIRREKARIRREVFDIEEQERLINELYKKLLPQASAKAEKKKETG